MQTIYTYKNQSTTMMRVTSSIGSPTAARTITMVTRPACGTPAAPMEAAVAVMLRKKKKKSNFYYYNRFFLDNVFCWLVDLFITFRLLDYSFIYWSLIFKFFFVYIFVYFLILLCIRLRICWLVYSALSFLCSIPCWDYFLFHFLLIFFFWGGGG